VYTLLYHDFVPHPGCINADAITACPQMLLLLLLPDVCVIFMWHITQYHVA